MDLATLAGHLAFGLIAFSFLVKDILWLRVVSIVASLFSVLYNFYIPAHPMWLAINWNIVFVLVNIYHIAVIIYEKRPIKMAPKDKELYETLFKDLSPVEYLKISKVAEWKKYKSGEFPKVLVIFGDTYLIKDYVMNDLKYQFNLSIQAVSGSRRRNANMFKTQLFDASQCNAAYKES